MAELLLLNPRRRRRKSSSRKARRRSRRRSRRRGMSALQMQFFGGGRRSRRRSRRVSRRSRRRSRNPVAALRGVSLPRSFGGVFSNLPGIAMNAAQGALGAIAVDLILNHAPIPDALRVGYARLGTKAALAVTLGVVGTKLPGIGRFAGKMAEGALIVAAHEALAPIVADATGFDVAGVGYYAPGMIANADGTTGAFPMPVSANGAQAREGNLGMYTYR